MKITLPFLILSLLLAQARWASAQTWNGQGTNDNWSNPTNWVGLATPLNNGTANIFKGPTPRLSPLVDVPWSINSLTFNSGVPSFGLRGLSLTIAAGVTNSASTIQYISNSITLGGTNFWGSTGSGQLNFYGNIINNSNPLNLVSSGNITLSGGISGDAGLNVRLSSGFFVVTLDGTNLNSYLGTTILSSGTLRLNKSVANGAIPYNLLIGGGFSPPISLQLLASEQINNAASVTLSNNGSFQMNTFSETISNLIMTGGLVNGSTVSSVLTVASLNFVSNSFSVSGSFINCSNLNLLASPAVIDIANGPPSVELTINAVLSGNGVVKTGLGILQFGGSSPNIYVGDTLVNAGALWTSKPANSNAIPGNLIIGDGLGGTNADSFRLLNNEQIADFTFVTVNSSGLFEVNGRTETIGYLIMNGGQVSLPFPSSLRFNGDLQAFITNTPALISGDSPVGLNLQGFRTLYVVDGLPDVDLEISAGITNGSLVQYGSGTVLLSGTATNSGLDMFQMNTGTLLLSRTNLNAAIPGAFIVGSGGIGTNVVRLLQPHQINDYSNLTVYSSGVLDLNGFDETIGPLTMSGGTIKSGSGTLTVLSNVTAFPDVNVPLITGHLDLANLDHDFLIVDDGSAAIDMEVDATVSNAGMTKKSDGTLLLRGEADFTAFLSVQEGTLILSNATVHNNFGLTGGTLTGVLTNESSGSSISNGVLAGTLVNNGHFTYNGGVFAGRLVNFGSFSSSPANFTMGNGLAHYSTLTLSSGRVYALNGLGLDNQATITLANGTLAGSGGLTNNGLLTGSGAVSGSGGFVNRSLLTVSGGSLNLNNTGFNANLGNIDLAPGLQLRLNGAALRNAGSINLNSGGVAGAATLSNAFGGTISGRGAITCPFSNQGGKVLLDSGTLSIANNFISSGNIQLSSLAATLGGGDVANSGTIQGLGDIGNNVANIGTIEAIGGTLSFSGSLLNASNGLLAALSSGKILVSSGLAENAGLISLSAGTFDNNNRPLNNTGQISGNGTFRSGGLANNGSATFSGGLSTINGNLTNQPTRRITVAYNPAIFTGTVVNNGTFKITSTTVQFTGLYIENGILSSDPATNSFTELFVGPAGLFLGDAGDLFTVSGNFINGSLQNLLWNTAEAQLALSGGPVHALHLPGADFGAASSGYTTNFAWKTFRLAAGESLVLHDGNATAGAALYTKSLILEGGLAQVSAITGNGFNLYYEPSAPGNAYLGGGTYSLTGGGAITPISQPALRITSITRLPNSSIQLDCTGVPNIAHSIQGSTNLLSWQTIGTVTAPASGVFTFNDTNAPARTLRFYRLSLP